MTQNKFSLVTPSHAHIPQMAEIERLCFSAPWSEQALQAEMDNPNAAFLLVTSAPADTGSAQAGGARVLAYVGMRFALDELNITNLAVRPEWRRHGLARFLLESVRFFAVQAGFRVIFLEARVSNTAARSLYQSLGYRETGVRKGYYDLPVEDAVLMTLFLPPESEAGGREAAGGVSADADSPDGAGAPESGAGAW